MTITGTALFVFGAFIACINAWGSFVRPMFVRLARRSLKRTSGFPLIGSLCLWTAAWLLHPASSLAYWALAVSLLDTGGPHWFIGSVVYHSLRGARHQDDA